MGEYGRVVSQGGGGGGGGAGGDLVGFVSGIVDRVLAQPPEILVAVAAILIVGGWLVLRR